MIVASEYEHEELTSIVTAIASVQAELQSYKSRALAAIDALDPAGNRTIDLGVTNSSLNLVIPGYTEPDQDNDNEEEIAKKEVVQ